MRTRNVVNLLLAGVGPLDFRKTHALRSILKAEKTYYRSAHGHDSRDYETPSPSAVVCGITHHLLALLHGTEAIPALDVSGQVRSYAGYHRAVSAHIRAHIRHYKSTDYHCGERTDTMRGVPNAHLGGKFPRSDPLREHSRARRIAETLEILVQDYGNAHHDDEHIHELRSLVNSGYIIGEIHSETETEVGGCT